MTDSTDKTIHSRHVPIIIGNCAPFRLVTRKSDKWEPTLEQINDRTYDYVKLCRLSMFIDVGIKPYSIAVSFDGSLILPGVEKFRNRDIALQKFNETLGILLLGGIYSEAIQPVDISFGTMFLDGYVKQHGGGSGAISNFHNSIRTKTVGIGDAIRLLEPRAILNTDIQSAYKKGQEYFQVIPTLSPSLLLNGISNYVKHQWIESLIFLWTSIEQLINIIWKKEIMLSGKNNNEEVIEGRSKFLEDFRTWTTSTKIEVLYQKRIINPNLYKQLNTARKSRNDFVHSSKELNENKVRTALESFFTILSLIVSDYKDTDMLSDTLEMVLRNQRGDLFPKKAVFEKREISHWMELPPLPGDPSWSGNYEIIKEFVLKPLEKP
jgi:hypothetical protein